MMVILNSPSSRHLTLAVSPFGSQRFNESTERTFEFFSIAFVVSTEKHPNPWCSNYNSVEKS